MPDAARTAPHHVPAWTTGIFLATAARLLLAAAIPILDDEAYYWVWSKHLAWGYLDHPPGIALALAASTTLFGDAPWAIRLPSILCALGTALLLAHFTADLTGDLRAGLRALVIFHAVPICGVGAFLAAPDALLGFFWTLAAWAAWRAARGDGRFWWLAGIAVGLGVESKYTMALLLPGLLVLGLENASRRPAPVATAALALGLFIPNFLWNATHGWIAFRYALARAPWIAPRDPLWNLGAYAAAVLFYLSPVLGGLLLISPWTVRRTEAGRFLWWGAAPTLFLLLGAALVGKAKPHYVLPAVLLGIAALCQWSSPHVARLCRIGIWTGLGLSALVTVLALLRPAFVPDLHGWPEVAARVREILGHRRAVLVTPTYQQGAQLAYATRNRYPVTVLPGDHAFAEWSPLERWRGEEALFVYDRRTPPRESLATWCHRATPLAPLHVRVGGRVVRTFVFVRCVGFSGRAMLGPAASGP